MIGRPGLDGETIANIDEMWARNPSASAAEIHRRLEGKFWPGYVGRRSVQKRVRDLKALPREKFEWVPWKPWQSQIEELPEETDYLLRLHGWKRLYTFLHRGLYLHEAKWAIQLMPSLSTLEDFHLHWYFIKSYSAIEPILHYLDYFPERAVAGLNAKLMYREWTPSGKARYGMGVLYELIEEIALPGRSDFHQEYDDYEFFEHCVLRYEATVEMRSMPLPPCAYCQEMEIGLI